MRSFVLPLFLVAIVCSPAAGQTATKISKGRAAVEAAYQYQNKLADSTVTIGQVIQNWSVVASTPDVQKDPDALAIAYGCEGLLEVQTGDLNKADSLLQKAMPLFRIRQSKSSFLVAYAEVERALKHNALAMKAYDEIVTTMDSVPALEKIEFYHLSGYAPYAYAIDAAYGIAQIAMVDSAERKPAITILTKAMDRHMADALGLMTVVALHELGAMSSEDYKFKVDLICSRKPELRDVWETFEKRIKSPAQ